MFFVFFAIGAGVMLASGFYMNFHAAGIDFWGILYYGRHMTLAEPESLYNGFFPVGYAWLIGQLPFTYVLPLAYILNALLAGLFTASVSTLVASTRSIPGAWIACFASIAAPFLFRNAITLGPDIGSAAFTAFAVFLLWRDRLENAPQAPHDLRSILTGVSLGLAFLWRTHAIVSAAAIFLGYFLFAGIRPFRSRIWMVLVFGLFVSVQVTVNLLSGHGVLETSQAYNIYKLFHYIDVTHPPTPAEVENFSLMETIRNDPWNSLRAYGLPFGNLLFYAWPAFACFLLAPKGRISRFALFLTLFVLLYAIPVALGDSARAPVILMGAYASALGLLVAVLDGHVKKLFNPGKWGTVIVVVLFIAAGFKTFRGWVVQDLDFVRTNRNERHGLGLIEQVLVFHGMESPTEVFADRYDFYTPGVMPYRPRQIGGLVQDWFWGFSDEFPPCQTIRGIPFLPPARSRGSAFWFFRRTVFIAVTFSRQFTVKRWISMRLGCNLSPKGEISGYINLDN